MARTAPAPASTAMTGGPDLLTIRAPLAKIRMAEISPIVQLLEKPDFKSGRPIVKAVTNPSPMEAGMSPVFFL